MPDADTSSANPVALETFASTAMQLDARLEVGAVSLRAAIAAFTASCREYPTGIDESLADQLQDLARRNTEISLWVRQVADQFTQADTGHVDAPVTQTVDQQLDFFLEPGSSPGPGVVAAGGFDLTGPDDRRAGQLQGALAGLPPELAAQLGADGQPAINDASVSGDGDMVAASTGPIQPGDRWYADDQTLAQPGQVPFDAQTATVDRLLAEGSPIVPEGQPQNQAGATDSGVFGTSSGAPTIGGGHQPPIEVSPPEPVDIPLPDGGHQPPIEMPPIDGGHQPPIEMPPIGGGHQPPIVSPPIGGWPNPVPGFPVQIGGGIATSTLGVGGWTLTPSRDPTTAPGTPEDPDDGIPVVGQPVSPPQPAPVPTPPQPPTPAPPPAPPVAPPPAPVPQPEGQIVQPPADVAPVVIEIPQDPYANPNMKLQTVVDSWVPPIVGRPYTDPKPSWGETTMEHVVWLAYQFKELVQFWLAVTGHPLEPPK